MRDVFEMFQAMEIAWRSGEPDASSYGLEAPETPDDETVDPFGFTVEMHPFAEGGAAC